MDYKEFNIIPPPQINVVDIEADLEDSYMAAFRGIFGVDLLNTYNSNEAKTGIIISSEFPEKDAPFKKPHLVVHDISYGFKMDQFMGQNFYTATNNPNVRNELNIVPYSLAISIYAGKSASRDIANRVINYICIVYKDLFNGLNLNISDVSKMPTQAASKYPETVFSTTIQIQGTTQWSASVETLNASPDYLLEQVNTEITIK